MLLTNLFQYLEKNISININMKLKNIYINNLLITLLHTCNIVVFGVTATFCRRPFGTRTITFLFVAIISCICYSL